MTKQEIYDKLVTAAYDGTFPSYDSLSGLCRYHYCNTITGKTHKCAVGIFIPDDAQYKPVERNIYLKHDDFFRKWFRELLDNNLCDKEIHSIQELHDSFSIDEKKWIPEAFVSELNKMPCFAEVKKKEIDQEN
jgi:hypothetical protein